MNLQSLKFPVSHFRIFIIFSSLLFLNLPAYGAYHYIRAAAGGANNGSSWTDAWTTFGSVTWTRGDTYYVAGGTYNEDVLIPTAESGANWIIVKKANAADNGGDPGWNAAYASDQAIINGRLSVYYGYVEINGVTGAGTTGHGIKIHLDSDRTGFNTVIAFSSGTASPRHLYCLDVQGPGFDYGSTGGDGIYWNSAIAGSKGFHIRNCWVHEIPRNGITLGTIEGASYADFGLMIENSVLERTGGVGMRYPNVHGQTIQFYARPLSYGVFRNNVFRNATGQAYISILGGVTTNYIRVYNNVFYSNNGDSLVYGLADSGTATSISQLYKLFTGYEDLVGRTLTNVTKGATGVITSVSNTTISMAGGMSGGALNQAGDEFSFPVPSRSAYFLATSIYSSAGNSITNAEIYNNTFYNIGKAAINFVTPSDTTGTIARNNLWVNGYFTDTRAFWPAMTNTGYYNNTFGPYSPVNTETSDPFNNSSVYDFHLKATANAVNAGADLGSIFNADFDGVARPQGQAWDIGAFEYSIASLTPDLTRTIGSLPAETALVYPNPARDNATFLIRLRTPGQVRLDIYNMAGEQVASLSGEAAGNELVLIWDCSQVSNGVYLASFTFGGGKHYTLKVAVVK